jgi:hypothetical protein
LFMSFFYHGLVKNDSVPRLFRDRFAGQIAKIGFAPGYPKPQILFFRVVHAASLFPVQGGRYDSISPHVAINSGDRGGVFLADFKGASAGIPVNTDTRAAGSERGAGFGQERQNGRVRLCAGQVAVIVASGDKARRVLQPEKPFAQFDRVFLGCVGIGGKQSPALPVNLFLLSCVHFLVSFCSAFNRAAAALPRMPPGAVLSKCGINSRAGNLWIRDTPDDFPRHHNRGRIPFSN